MRGVAGEYQSRRISALSARELQAANRIQSEEGRKVLLHIAEVWQHFAEQEKREGSASDPPDIPVAPATLEQPAAQQQQQVQPKDDDKKE
jgi:hypothetical protein